MPFLDRGWSHQVGTIVPAIQTFRKQHPQYPESCCESWSWVLFLVDTLLAGRQLALHSQELGSQHCIGTEKGHDDEGHKAAKHRYEATDDITQVDQKGFQSIHAARIAGFHIGSKLLQVLI